MTDVDATQMLIYPENHQIAKKRKANFTASEKSYLADLVKDNYNILFGQFSSSLTAKMKHEKWEEIAGKINAIGVGSRTVAELKTLWNNLQMKAKKANGFEKRESVKTGGGPAPTPLDETTNVIISFMNDKPSFSGIPGGVETGPVYDTNAIFGLEAEPKEEDSFTSHDPSTSADMPIKAESSSSSSSCEKRRISTGDVTRAQYNNLIEDKKRIKLECQRLDLTIDGLKLKNANLVLMNAKLHLELIAIQKSSGCTIEILE
ncbi:PREDICTED: myb/SANT-like DNA-binding domain-containing protein 4 [Priapulus caudatus]|uniref:Regulatory protein zeste n=1 Tax=Priapulus caudatus TaxID=37621 RepID=A0ABM1EGT5_PRICU|nr:PREDICTED: myb/SANT-like DNA-binding domain-containing protein 4 [Priapulus caudatus]